jgi:muramidase (phage lysozyme)
MAELYKTESGGLQESKLLDPSKQDISTLDMSGLTSAIEDILNKREEKKKPPETVEDDKEDDRDVTSVVEGMLAEGKEDYNPPKKAEVPTMAEDLSPQARAFLETISEAEGTAIDRTYQAIVGLGKGVKGAPAYFEDYSKHPNVIGYRGPEGPSTAAGRYQITKQTWDEFSKKYSLKDFSPANQDKAAWYIAKERYSRKSNGRDLEEDLNNGVTKYIQPALGGTWTSLKTSFNFTGRYQQRVSPSADSETGPGMTVNKWDY